MGNNLQIITDYSFDEEQSELEKEHEKLFHGWHFKIGDRVSMIGSNHLRFSKPGILYNLFEDAGGVYIRSYNTHINKSKNLIISDIEYEDQFGMVIQRLYFGNMRSVDMDFRRSFYYDYTRRHKIKKILKEI